MPADVLRIFSRRRAEIVEEPERLGAGGRNAAEVATLATRRAKDYRVSPETLMPEWLARLEEMGFGRAELTTLLARAPVRETRIEREALFAGLLAPTGLTARRSTFSRRELFAGARGAIPPERAVTVEGLQLLADALVAQEDVVRITRWGSRGIRSASS